MVSVITCLNECGILTDWGQSCSQDRWISFFQLDREIHGQFSRKRPQSGDPKKNAKIA